MGALDLPTVTLALAVSAAIGWALGKFVKGRPVAGALWGFAGPLGWVIVLFAQETAYRCPLCRRFTPYHPPVPGVPAAHLRCVRCGEIIG